MFATLAILITLLALFIALRYVSNCRAEQARNAEIGSVYLPKGGLYPTHNRKQ